MSETQQIVSQIVAWLRREAGVCDCFARSAGECVCGAWDDCKRVDPREIATAIERGEHLITPGSAKDTQP